MKSNFLQIHRNLMLICLLSLLVIVLLVIPTHLRAFSSVGNQSNSDLTITSVIFGDYTGQATLQSIYNGTLDNTAALSSTMDLGYIDLAFNLNQANDGKVTGNVILSRTLVFSATEGHIQLTSEVVGGKTRIKSSPFTMKMNEARIINGEQIAPERIVKRQFSLDAEQILNDGATILGTYRETIWGYAPEPVTVVGKFALERPVFSAAASGGIRPRIFMPLVRR
jgi:hypothetical protein